MGGKVAYKWQFTVWLTLHQVNKELLILTTSTTTRVSSACMRTNVIVAGKCGSRRQSTTSFVNKNVVVAKTEVIKC